MDTPNQALAEKTKYVLYARKSTESDEKQALSNLTLKDQKLNIGEYEPFLIIKNTLEFIKSDSQMLGTTNNTETLNKNKLPELVDEKLLAWLPG